MIKTKTLDESMTLEEKQLYEKTPEDYWGDAYEAANRGAAFLDREMPGWADRVEINTLMMSSGCQCVLGQIFRAEKRNGGLDDELRDYLYKQGISADNDTEYLLGIGVFGWYGETHSELEGEDEDDGKATAPAVFFGFDHGGLYTYSDLEAAWKPLIEARKTAVPA